LETTLTKRADLGSDLFHVYRSVEIGWKRREDRTTLLLRLS
jgi:hypothetical protein